MLSAIFTLDYEIHGNGDGSPWDLMVEPTARMMGLFESYGAKLTIMADVAEILKFKEYKEQVGRDDYFYEAIADQLRDAVRRGHDVQLHLHASYFNARHEKGRWKQDWSEYDFARLPLCRLKEIVRLGKLYLETLLKPVTPGYKCFVFRAANWSMSPSQNVIRALVDNNIRIDTSVFKYGRREGLVNFDYSNAPSNLIPWRSHERDICRLDDAGVLLEVPIYSEHRWIGAFLSLNRLYRAISDRAHPIERDAQKATRTRSLFSKVVNRLPKLSTLTKRHAWKADFNQCTGKQLIAALRRAEGEHNKSGADLPFTLIGHSKLFTRQNGVDLRAFLSFVASNPARFAFTTFSRFDSPKDLPVPDFVGKTKRCAA
jgi:hypothetical protein